MFHKKKVIKSNNKEQTKRVWDHKKNLSLSRQKQIKVNI